MIITQFKQKLEHNSTSLAYALDQEVRSLSPLDPHVERKKKTQQNFNPRFVQPQIKTRTRTIRLDQVNQVREREREVLYQGYGGTNNAKAFTIKRGITRNEPC